MELTHEMAGLFISAIGVLCIALSGPIPRQVHRWHVHALDTVEPVMITWLVRALGFTLAVLGLVTLANPG
jgi:hypothetical protein